VGPDNSCSQHSITNSRNALTGLVIFQYTVGTNLVFFFFFAGGGSDNRCSTVYHICCHVQSLYTLSYMTFEKKRASLPVNYLPYVKLCIDITEDGLDTDRNM